MIELKVPTGMSSYLEADIIYEDDEYEIARNGRVDTYIVVDANNDFGLLDSLRAPKDCYSEKHNVFVWQVDNTNGRLLSKGILPDNYPSYVEILKNKKGENDERE